MGFLRLGLALVVLLFHAGYGGGGGPVAVYAFYVISGFLISRVYLEKYQPSPGGLRAFYRNRALRILPLFVVASLLAYLALLAAGTWVPVKAIPVNGAAYMTQSTFSISDFLAGLRPDLRLQGSPPRLIAFFGWIPQFWSVSVELVFYALAPGMCLARKRYGPAGTWAILAVTAVVYATYAAMPSPGDLHGMLDILYLNAVPSMFFFACGMALFELTGSIRGRIPFAAALACCVGALVAMLAGTKYFHAPLSPVREVILWQCLAPLAAVPAIFSMASASPGVRRAEQFCADVGYGVYLNQSVTLPLYFAWRMAIGRTDYPHTGFGPYLLLASATIALSWVTYVWVEKTFNRGRKAVPAPLRDAAQSGVRVRAKAFR